MPALLLSLAIMVVSVAVLFGGVVALSPFIVDLCLLALALAGSHAAVGFADAPG